MDVRGTPGLSSKEKLRNMEEELKKWREEKKRQSIVPKENQALNAKTPSVRKSTAVFTPSVAKAPQTTQVDHKFKRRSEIPAAPKTPSVRTESSSVLSDASMNLLKRKLEMSFNEADDKSEKNKLLQAVQQQQATDQATIDRRLLLEKWRKEKEEQKQKEQEKKRQSAQPRYNQPAGVVSPFHKKCKHAGPCDHEQVEFKTPAKPVVKKPAKPVGHSSSDSMQNAFKFVPATESMFSNPYKMFDPLSDPRRLTLGGVTARQLLSELTPKSNKATFKQLTEAVANNSFFKRTVRKVAKEIIRHSAAQKCMRIMKGSNYEQIMAAFDAMQFEASWPVVRKCAFYWLFRAKVEERHGDYKRAISTFEAATRNQATPIEVIHNGLQQFMATLRRLAGQNKAAAAEKKEVKVEQKPVEIKVEPVRETIIEAPRPIEPVTEPEVEQVTDAVADLAIEEAHDEDFEFAEQPETETAETVQHEETHLDDIEEESSYYIPQGGLVVTPAKTPRGKLSGFKKVQRMSMTPLGKPGRILVENAETSVVQPRSLNFDRDSLDSATSDADNQPAQYYGTDDVPMSDDVEEEHYEQQQIEVEAPAPVEDESPTNEKVTLIFDKVDANVQDDTYYVLEKHKLSKKEKEEFGTDVALTPARRSVRLVPHARKQDEDVSKMLEEVQYSYTPNKALKTFEQPKKGKKKILSSAEELMRTLHENKKQDERKKREKKAALAEPITEEEEVEEAKRLSLLPGEILGAPESVFLAYNKKVHPSLYKQFQKVPSEHGFGLYSDLVPVLDKAAHVEMPTPVRRSHRLHKK
eukprot:TRINITY_DN4199_c0_g1_i1.p1 TRINITY_DN4199_c0_g1~~TRINITY_DN4199_c0_g1_i1.p1  ORF type:complete len:815 (-),score=310.47 TRINITY_DN4199_c0_g1_i1:118-2535(-)